MIFVKTNGPGVEFECMYIGMEREENKGGSDIPTLPSNCLRPPSSQLSHPLQSFIAIRLIHFRQIDSLCLAFQLL